MALTCKQRKQSKKTADILRLTV